jgi:hypothetical protein
MTKQVSPLQRVQQKRALKIFISTTFVGEPLAAWCLMFGLALLGHPVGFLALWLTGEGVATLISAGVTSGLSGFAYVNENAKAEVFNG